MISEVGFTRNTSPNRAQKPPRYELVVPELDELVKVIFETSSLNPDFFTGGQHPDALRYLKEQNH
jgi:hypothetical protein